jgi:uncharacterized membrane protein
MEIRIKELIQPGLGPEPGLLPGNGAAPQRSNQIFCTAKTHPGLLPERTPVFSSTVFWTSTAGSLSLILGFILYRRDLAAARGLDRLIVLGPVFVAASLATFGAEHLRAGHFMADMVPHWIPWHLFWIYFVGLCLIAAALSFLFRRCVGWSAPLLAGLFLIFVFTMDLPGTLSHPANRINWVLLFREAAFAAGALALTATAVRHIAETTAGRTVAQPLKPLAVIARIIFGAVLVFYGVQHFLHPECVIGVPLEKITPAWIPVHAFWACVTGAIELIAGVALLINKRPRLAAAIVGAVNTALVLFFYTPILVTCRGTVQVVEGINYVFDTLLFAGAVLLLAAVMPQAEVENSKPRPMSP